MRYIKQFNLSLSEGFSNRLSDSIKKKMTLWKGVLISEKQTMGGHELIFNLLPKKSPFFRWGMNLAK